MVSMLICTFLVQICVAQSQHVLAQSNVWVEIVNEIPDFYFVDYILKTLFFYMSSRLTHLSRMIFSTLIKWTSPFPFEGSVGGIFQFCSNFIRTQCPTESALGL